MLSLIDADYSLSLLTTILIPRRQDIIIKITGNLFNVSATNSLDANLYSLNDFNIIVTNLQIFLSN